MITDELSLIETVFPVSERKRALLVGWSEEGSMNPNTGQVSPPPGRCLFMLKTGDEPGVPFRVNLTAGERHGVSSMRSPSVSEREVNSCSE